MEETLVVVLGGGRGTRLQPLTAKRAKPAVPLAGKYRLIDIPISNAIHSGFRKVYVLTQFNSASLNSHITKAYRFDHFSRGFVEVLAAEQTEKSGDWYQGTADAVRQQLHHFDRSWVRDVIILSGDHLYRMDYSMMLLHHREMEADLTVSCIPVTRERCSGFGVLGADDRGLLRDFREKPDDGEDLSSLMAPDRLRQQWGMGQRPYLASMGVYVFRREALRELLRGDGAIDFGHHVIPNALGAHRVAAYVFDDYWEDIGSIASFYTANLALCGAHAPFDFFHNEFPIYTRARFLPPSKVVGCEVDRTLVGDGCELIDARVSNSVIGLRSRLRGCDVRDSIIMGADFYEDEATLARHSRQRTIPVGIAEGCSIRRAIIDKNARIAPGCVIHGSPDRPDEEHDDWAVRDGIVVVTKNSTFPPGTRI